MTVGFQSWGANGSFIQIDSSYRCQRLTAHDRVTTDFSWGLGFIANTFQGNYTAKVLRVNGEYPIVAIRCGSTTAVMTKRVANNAWDYTFIAAGNLGTPIDYWVFNEQLPAPSNIGIQIFRNDGVVVFDGNDIPARVMDYRSITNIAGGANYQEQLLADFGRGNWATVQNSFSTQTIYETGGARRALLMTYGIITRGNQLFGCRSISAMYPPPIFGQYGSSSFHSMGYLTLDLDSI